jgi:hypothetical protein
VGELAPRFGNGVRRVGRIGLGMGVVAAIACVAPGLASACTVPGGPDSGFDPPQDFSGTVTAAQQGSYLQIPFNVPAGTTAIRIRYCWDEPPDGTTLDIGVYEPTAGGVPGPAERRGWSGSAVRDLAIAVNGFSPPGIYESDRKAYVRGHTTRAYRPGPLPPGQWTAELGIAAVGGPSVGFDLRVETTSSADWSDDPYAPAVQSSAPANPNPGWYAGDLHAHGEQEPGNAQVSTSLDYSFRSLAAGGAGLDFVGLVDHNNDVARGEVGRYEPAHPGRLVIPGVEVTTYHGHYNVIGSSAFADFRGGPVLSYPSAGELAPTTVPASQLAAVRTGGGWTQINHPTIFPGQPAVCRGCPWDWTAGETGYENVDAIEIQTGPADIGNTPNPFTKTAIAFYEARLAAGDHVAAVGSSDSHQADQSSVTSAPIGRATTVVRADELSKPAIVEGIRDGRTYVKLYGNDGPDIRVAAHAPGAPDGMLGDTVSGPELGLEVQVLRAGPGAVRPGSYRLELLRDGAVLDGVAVAGDDFTHTFAAADPARYAVQVMREDPRGDRYEVYSSPVWFERGENLTLGKLKRNKRKGTARLTVAVAHPGELTLRAKGTKTARRTVAAAGQVKLKVKPKGKVKRKLRRTGKAKVRLRVEYAPTGGEAATAARNVKLKRRR